MNGCSEVVMNAVSRETASLYPAYYEDPSKKHTLYEYCMLVDRAVRELGGEFCGVKIGNDTKNISVTIQTDNFDVYPRTSPFTIIADKASSITFTSGPSDDLLFITITFPGIWVTGIPERSEKGTERPKGDNPSDNTDEKEKSDEILHEISDRFKAYVTQTTVVNPLMLKEFTKAYNLAKWAFPKATVSYGLYKPLKTAGYISVTGKRISLGRPNETLIRIKDLADSFGVTPYKDGSVQLLFAFRDIMISMN